ncbi:uncharacterized protein BJX67DRAFT_140694 [Aspergillus lucknowensis]|uniref:Transmembrane protein n=1 Tax=Aspergillus lucknowensis TaxID=176173 RepID=A0ABR4LPK5_9EURO
MAATHLFSSLVASVLIAQSVAQYEYDPNDVDSQNEAGAAGPSSSGGMSTGGMIALCVIVGVVVIIGFSSAGLFYLAKKRQWAMREKLRQSARQVVKAVKTPLTPKFPRSQRPQTRDRDRVHREAAKVKTQKRQPTDVEKDAVITADEESKNSDPKPRGWSSYFSFNRS